MATQIITNENQQGLLATSIKTANLKEMKMVCSLLTFIHQEINDYEMLHTLASKQYASQLFSTDKEFSENLKNNLLEYSSKLKTYRNIANMITELLSEKGN